MSIVIQNQIQAQLESTEQFPVDFEIYWQWLGYSRKDSAKRAFENSGFEENADYHLHNTVGCVNQAGLSAQEISVLKRTEQIFLTVECAKSFAMLSQTEQGKQVRKWYIEIEKQWRVSKDKTQHSLPTAKEAMKLVKQFKEMHDFAVSIGNVRLQAQYETAIAQYNDVYVLPESTKQPIVNGQPSALTGSIQYEGVIDVVIRLGLQCPSNFEPTLGTYAGKRISHLRVSTSDAKLKDYRASQASGKVVPAYMYPAFNPEVEKVVREFCSEMEAKNWMTGKEIKAAKQQAKLAATMN